MARHRWVEESVPLDADNIASLCDQGKYLGFQLTLDQGNSAAVYAYAGHFPTGPDRVLKLKRQIRLPGYKTTFTGTQHLQLTSTPCNFGGERWWFVCPFCKHHRKDLWWHPESGLFACRVCLRLKYHSQSENYRWDTRGYGFLPGIRYVSMREHRADLMATARSRYRANRSRRYQSRRRAEAESQS